MRASSSSSSFEFFSWLRGPVRLPGARGLTTAIGKDRKNCCVTPVKLVLLRCCARPPFAQDRLGWWNEEQEQLIYQFRRPLPDGRTCEILSAMDLMKRLTELIPPPWMNLVRYYGVLAPNAKIREQVVMLAGPSEELRLRLQQAAEEMGPDAEPDLPEPAPSQSVPGASNDTQLAPTRVVMNGIALWHWDYPTTPFDANRYLIRPSTQSEAGKSKHICSPGI